MSTDGPVTTELGGHTWLLGLLGTTESLDTMTRLAKLVGPALTGNIAQGDKSGVPAALAALFSKADPKEVHALIKKLLGGCLMDGRPLFAPDSNGKAGVGGIYEVVFKGRLPLLFKVVGWAIRENFGDFSESPEPDEASSAATLDGGPTSETTTQSSVS